MIIVLFGPPAVGKGTQAARLQTRHGIANLSTGEMLRAAIAADTPIGKRAKAVVDAGGLVSDKIVLGIVGERIKQADCDNGFILDGIPRTVAQAKGLDRLLRKRRRALDVVIVIEADEPALTARVVNRADEARAKGAPVRPDDDPETFKRRLAVYKAETAPVLPYYEKQRKLIAVDGMSGVDGVAAQIDEAVALVERRKSWFGRLFNPWPKFKRAV